MAWHQIGDKPLSLPMLTQFTDAYMWHLGGDELNNIHVSFKHFNIHMVAATTIDHESD